MFDTKKPSRLRLGAFVDFSLRNPLGSSCYALVTHFCYAKRYACETAQGVNLYSQ